MGVIMIALGGIWACFKDHLGRIFGYAVMIEIGLSFVSISFLLEVSASPQTGLTALPTSMPVLNFFFIQLIPRGLNLALGALALAIIRSERGGLDFQSIKGVINSAPIASIAYVIAIFSFAGFPLLAGFPMRFLLSSYLGQSSLLFAALTILGYGGLMFGGLRSLWWMGNIAEAPVRRRIETRFQLLLLIAGCLVLLLIGIFPQILLANLATLAFPIAP
jgi:formate hydrogenlyase subunit 3/multisubunit Na+/H+ antiporter MnhD subunit